MKYRTRADWLGILGILVLVAGAPMVMASAGSADDRDAMFHQKRDTRLVESPVLLTPVTGGPVPGLLPDFGGIDVPLPRSVNFANTVPAREHNFSSDLPPVDGRDTAALAVGLPDGRVAVIIREELHMHSLLSTDSGANFAPGVPIPTVPAGSGFLFGYVELGTGGDDLYVVQGVPDPGGEISLQVVRSPDFGVSWNAPVVLTTKGDDTHGASEARVSAWGSTVAVVYRERVGGDVYARISNDTGTTYNPRIRVNSGTPDGQGLIEENSGVFVEVDPSGVIHVAFIENRGAGNNLYYTRSTDSGATFEAVRNFDAILTGGRQQSAGPFIQTTQDGSVLLSFVDYAGDDRIYVLRSTDSGATFSLVLDHVFANENLFRQSVLLPSPDSGTVLLHFLNNGEVTTRRSGDNGATWGAASILAGTGISLRNIAAPSMVRTQAGNYAIGWTDRRSDSYFGKLADIYLRISTDDGVTWGAEHKINSSSAGSSTSSIHTLGLAAAGADEVVVTYYDGRTGVGNTSDIYSDHATAAAPAFTNDRRIDVNDDPSDVNIWEQVALASTPAAGGGAEYVYAAMPVVVSGPEPEIRVSVSSDGGYNWGLPVAVHAGGAEREVAPKMAATPGGKVHVIWTMFQAADMQWHLMYSRSDDFGATWAAEVDLGVAVLAEYDLVVPDESTVLITWADNLDIRLSRSADGGATFFPSTIVNSNPTDFNRNPEICAVDGNVFVLFAAPDVAFLYYTAKLSPSTDGGATFGPEEQLLPDGASGGSFYHNLDCYRTGGGDVVAAALLEDYRTGASVVTLEGYQVGVGQMGEFAGGPALGNEFRSGIECGCCGDECAYVFMASEGDYLGRWNTVYHGRADFSAGTSTTTRLTSDTPSGTGAPLPSAPSYGARIAADDTGNQWVFWIDDSAGFPEVAVRHSADDGVTFGDTWRLSSQEPQGTSWNVIENFLKNVQVTTQDGEAFFAWSGLRGSTYYSGMVNAFDQDDFDRDGVPAATDCSDVDPFALAVPVEVVGVAVDKGAGTVDLTWISQDAAAGPATGYDIVSGLLSDLQGTGDYSAATCLVTGHPDTPFADTRPDPPVHDAHYYLVRAANTCGTATYGDSGLVVDPRDNLDAAGPCP